MKTYGSLLLTGVVTIAAALSHITTFAQQSGRTSARIDSLGRAADSAFAAGDYLAAADAYGRCLELCERTGNERLICKYLNGLGRSYMSTGRNEKAMECLGKALAIAEKLDEKVIIAGALTNIGIVRTRFREYDKARALLERSLRMHEEVKNSMGASTALHALGKLLQATGDHAAALEYLKRCLALREELGDKRGAVFTLQAMGFHYREVVHDYPPALECYEKSLTYAAAIGNRAEMAEGHNGIGTVLEDMGEYETALAHLLKSLAILEELGQKGRIADAVTNIGNIHQHRGEYDMALRFYERAALLREAVGDSSGLSKALNNIGVVHYKCGRHRQAVEHYNRSMELREKLGDKRGMTHLLSNIALIHQARDDHYTAIEYLERCLDAYTDLKDESGMSASLINIGQSKTSLGFHREAIEFMQRGLDMAREIGHKEWMRNALRGLSVAYASLGDFEQAFATDGELLRVERELLNEKNMRSMNELTARYESERSRRRIAILERDSAMRVSALEAEQKARAFGELEAQRYLQKNILLIKDSELQRTELERRSALLNRRNAEIQLNGKRIDSLNMENKLRASIASRETLLRNGLLAMLGLTLVTIFLGYKRSRSRHAEVALRARTVELEARALKSENLAILTESERRKREDMERFARRLIELQEEERARIARELHDSLGQELLVIKNQAHMAMQEIGQVERLSKRLGDMKETALEVLEEIRLLSRNLRPVQLERSGLSNTVMEMLRQVEDTCSLVIEPTVEDVDGLFPPEHEINVYRILQESLNNVLKHANAEKVTVSMRRGNGDVRLTIADDGRGFDVETALGSSGGLGLRGIQERVQIMRGSMEIKSSENNGTSIKVMLPAASPAAAGEVKLT